MTRNSKDYEGLARRDFVKMGAGAGAWMATLGTRPGLAQGQGTRSGASIDFHCHFRPAAYLKFLGDLGQGSGRVTRELASDPAARIERMDAVGVQTQVLTIGGASPWNWMPAGAAARLCSIYNDAAIEACTAYPGRFVVGAALPVLDPDLALQELNRVAGQPGVRVVDLPCSIQRQDYWLDPGFEKVWSRIEVLGYPVVFHPLDGVYYSDRLTSQADVAAQIQNSLGFPFDTTTTATKLITRGILDKFPKLNCVWVHAGGTFPYILGRIGHGFNRREFGIERELKEYVTQYYFDTLTFYPETLRFLINIVGAGQVVIGTDNYATMDVDDPNGLVEELNLPPADRDRILRGNGMKILGL